MLKNVGYYPIFIGKCKRKESQEMKLTPGETQMEENEVLDEQNFFQILQHLSSYHKNLTGGQDLLTFSRGMAYFAM